MTEQTTNPHRLWAECKLKAPVSSGKDAEDHASYFKAIQRHAHRLADSIDRLKIQEPVHLVHILPYQGGSLYMDPSDFLCWRKSVLRHVHDIAGLKEVQAVIGLYYPSYFARYDHWLAQASLVVIGQCHTGLLHHMLAWGHQNTILQHYRDAEVITRFKRCHVVGPISVDKATDALRGVWSVGPANDRYGAARFVAGLRESDLLILRGIRQMPGGRLAFKN